MRDLPAEDRVRLAAAWIKRGDTRTICVACGGLRADDAPPCACQLEAAAARGEEWALGRLEELRRDACPPAFKEAS